MQVRFSQVRAHGHSLFKNFTFDYTLFLLPFLCKSSFVKKRTCINMHFLLEQVRAFTLPLQTKIVSMNREVCVVFLQLINRKYYI